MKIPSKKRIRKHSHEGGYLLLLAMLISSILLAVALGIYSLGLKELIISSFAKNSEIAVAAADRGLECALYWDSGYPQNGRNYTVFATSTGGNGYAGANAGSEPAGVLCQTGTSTMDISTNWKKSNGSATGYKTEFDYNLTNNSCTKVVVLKRWLGGAWPAGYQESEIISFGYNLPCWEATNETNTNPRMVQRILDVKLRF